MSVYLNLSFIWYWQQTYKWNFLEAKMPYGKCIESLLWSYSCKAQTNKNHLQRAALTSRPANQAYIKIYKNPISYSLNHKI